MDKIYNDTMALKHRGHQINDKISKISGEKYKNAQKHIDTFQ